MKIVTKIFFFIKPVTTPIFGFLLACTLIISAQAFADTTNFFTGCVKNSGTHNIYNAQIGTTPTSPCNGSDSQISADYGDITSIAAGTGLTGGATQGAATLSITNGGVSTAQLADTAVTAAKINSQSAVNGQVLTASGTGSASWQTPSSGVTDPEMYRPLAKVENVDFTIAQTVDLFTVPAGKLFLPLAFIIYTTDSAGNTIDPEASIGMTGPNYNDWAANSEFTNIKTTLNSVVFGAPHVGVATDYPLYPTGTVFKMKINTAADGTVLTGVVRVFGMSIDAQ